MKHSVFLVAYLHDGQPTVLSFQDIKTWPTLKLSQIPTPAVQLGLPDLCDFTLFDPQNTIWIPTINHALLVGTNDNIYMRRRELVSCGLASNSSLEYLSPTRFELARSSQKRRADSSLGHGSSPAHSTMSARRDHSHDYAGHSSPPSDPSRFSSPPLPPTVTLTTLAPLSTLISSGNLAQYQLQRKPLSSDRRECTLAIWRKALISPRTRKDRRLSIFTGMVWKQSTYHKN